MIIYLCFTSRSRYGVFITKFNTKWKKITCKKYDIHYSIATKLTDLLKQEVP